MIRQAGRVFVVVALLGVCVAGGAARAQTQTQTPAQSTTPQPVIATAAPEDHAGMKLDINSLHRDAAGVVTLTWTLTNGSQQEFKANAGTFNTALSKYAGDAVTDVTLIDEDHRVRYRTLRDATTNYCVCTAMGVTGDHEIIEPGNSAQYYDAYTLPADVTRVSIEIPGFVGVKNIPVR